MGKLPNIKPMENENEDIKEEEIIQEKEPLFEEEIKEEQEEIKEEPVKKKRTRNMSEEAKKQLADARKKSIEKRRENAMKKKQDLEKQNNQKYLDEIEMLKNQINELKKPKEIIQESKAIEIPKKENPVSDYRFNLDDLEFYADEKIRRINEIKNEQKKKSRQEVFNRYMYNIR
jgi:hypothetical protein